MGPYTAGFFDRIGEFGGVGGGQGDHGAVAGFGAQGGGKTDGAVGIQKLAGCFQGLGNGFGGFGFIYGKGVELLADGRQFLLAQW